MPSPNPTIVAWMLNEIEADLKKLGQWSSATREEALIASSRAAFCMDVMPFTQWLQDVFLHNARAIAASPNPRWPSGSMVATQAIRELDGMDGTDELIDHLSKFDALFNGPLDANGFPTWLDQKHQELMGEATVNASVMDEASIHASHTTPLDAEGIHPREPIRVSLALLPTPLLDAPRLAASAGVPRLLIKRDDLTGLELSGNKIRKLEYLIAEAQKNGCDTLVTHGGYQSNHCRATAAAGARLGMRVRIFLRAPADTMSPAKDGNLFLDELFGARISFHSPDDYKDNLAAIRNRVMDDERKNGRAPYFFPVGASVPIGVWGYIRCMHELRAQHSAGPVDLYVATSSAGTLAGCIIGRALFGLDDWRIIGIPVSDSVDYFQREVRFLMVQTIDLYSLGLAADQTPIELLDGYIGEGYAIPYPAVVDTIKVAATQAGLILDPTYTGKAMHGMLDTLRKGGGRREATPIFVHTGGAFGLMARRDLLA